MHFDFEAYEKVYPSQPETVKQPETMAEGFEAKIGRASCRERV